MSTALRLRMGLSTAFVGCLFLSTPFLGGSFLAIGLIAIGLAFLLRVVLETGFESEKASSSLSSCSSSSSPSTLEASCVLFE